VKLYQDALEPLREKVIYMDTDSLIYVSPTGAPLINIDNTGELGLWSNEGKQNDPFVEFVSSGQRVMGFALAQALISSKVRGFTSLMLIVKYSFLILLKNKSLRVLDTSLFRIWSYTKEKL
jgi:hypothetical protein